MPEGRPDPSSSPSRFSVSVQGAESLGILLLTVSCWAHFLLDGGSLLQTRLATTLAGLTVAATVRKSSLRGWLAVPQKVGGLALAMLPLAWPPTLPAMGIPSARSAFFCSLLFWIFLLVWCRVLGNETTWPLRLGLTVLLPIFFLQLTVNSLYQPLVLKTTSPVTYPIADVGWQLRPNQGYKIFYESNDRGYFEEEPLVDAVDLRVCHLAPPVSTGWEIHRPMDRSGRLELVAAGPASPTKLVLEVGPLTAGRPCQLQVEISGEGGDPVPVSLIDVRSLRPIGFRGTLPMQRTRTLWEQRITPTQTTEFAAMAIDLLPSAGRIQIHSVSLTGQQPSGWGPQRTRYSVFHQTNSAGFRDRERTIARSPDTLRVAILSDSYGFGWGVKDSDHVSARLEAILRSRRPASAPVEVLNFAVPGYRTKEERLLYEKVVEKYDPQVVLVLTVFNDNPVYDGLGIEDLAAPSLWRFFVPNQESRRQELDYSVCLNEMRQLAERCRGGHRKLMVATFRNNAFDEARWLALHRTMADGLRNEEVPVLDLGQAIGPYLREDWERGFVSRTEDSHPNEEVHRVAAEALAPWLIEHLPSGTSTIPSR